MVYSLPQEGRCEWATLSPQEGRCEWAALYLRKVQINELPHEKPCFFHLRKQRRRSAAQ